MLPGIPVATPVSPGASDRPSFAQAGIITCGLDPYLVPIEENRCEVHRERRAVVDRQRRLGSEILPAALIRDALAMAEGLNTTRSMSSPTAVRREPARDISRGARADHRRDAADRDGVQSLRRRSSCGRRGMRGTPAGSASSLRPRSRPFVGHPTNRSLLLAALRRCRSRRGGPPWSLEEEAGRSGQRHPEGASCPSACSCRRSLPRSSTALDRAGGRPQSRARRFAPAELKRLRRRPARCHICSCRCGIAPCWPGVQVDGGAWRAVLAHSPSAAGLRLLSGSGAHGLGLEGRTFGPGLGIVEDPATGSAAAAIAGYLAGAISTREGTLRWRMANRGFSRWAGPALLDVEADIRQGTGATGQGPAATAARMSRGVLHPPSDAKCVRSPHPVASSRELLPAAISRYLDVAGPASRAELQAMEAEAVKTNFPIIGPACGYFCYLVTKLSQARNIFELGSGFWILDRVVPPGESRKVARGVVHHTFGTPSFRPEPRRHLAAAGTRPPGPVSHGRSRRQL